jgi:hypothetical protein
MHLPIESGHEIWAHLLNLCYLAAGAIGGSDSAQSVSAGTSYPSEGPLKIGSAETETSLRILKGGSYKPKSRATIMLGKLNPSDATSTRRDHPNFNQS